MEDDLILFLKLKIIKLRFFKDRKLRKLRHLLWLKYEFYRNRILPIGLNEKIEFQKIICDIK